MINFNESPNPLLDAIEKIHQSLEGSQFDEKSLTDCLPETKLIAKFLKISDQQALVIGLMLHQHYNNSEPSIRDLIDHLEIKTSAAININKLVAPLVKKHWLSPKQDLRYFPLTNYKLNSRFIHCVSTMNWENWKEKPVKNSIELLERFNQRLKERKAKDISSDELIEENYSMISKYENIELCSQILELDLEPTDATYFLYMCLQHYLGEDYFELDCLIKDINPSFEEQYQFRMEMKNKKGIFFEYGLVESFSENGLAFTEQFCLTEIAIQSFNKSAVGKKREFNSKILSPKEESSIKTKAMFYEEQELQLVNRLGEIIQPKSFDSFITRMEEKGMTQGLTVLLYGEPGTGKTETVFQLAKKSGRSVLMADASVIRSKWVGETEKNVRLLFKEYKKACDFYDEIPILLFNEADAIMGTRRTVSDRVAQMENTMQNILLQELENFEGIFIATTNLEENLDNAFDRRILYKIRFEKPSEKMRLNIWKDKFPTLEQTIYEQVNKEYKLSGGQIDNICKKTEVDLLLNPEMKITYDSLKNLAEQEVILQQTGRNKRNPIGFLRNTTVAIN